MPGTTKVALVQINNSFSQQNYLPYSVGLLQGFAQKYLSDRHDFEFMLPVYERLPVAHITEGLKQAEIAFFSLYTWNLRISLEIARQMKGNNPELLVVFGGPEVPDRNSETFLRKYPFIDLACHGEGEKTFLSILENYSAKNWRTVESISFVEKSGLFVKTPLRSRIHNLEIVPSPYTSGVFAPLMSAKPNEKWIILWETNRGCPFSCSYCVWGADAHNRLYQHDMEKLAAEIDWFSSNKIDFIFCCDANFGILDRDLDIVKKLVENKSKHGYPKAFSVQSTKKFSETTYEIYRTMSEAGLSKGVSLAFQSTNPETLKDIRRKNIPIEVFQETQKNLALLNIETFSDFILGLPSETYRSFADGVSSVIENGQHNRIQFNNLSILTNSEMDDPKFQNQFGLEIVETDIVNLHGSLSEIDEVQERQQLVVATNSMDKNDWVRTRVFAWMIALLYFDKLLQIPLIILNKTRRCAVLDLLEVFLDRDIDRPLFSYVRDFFTAKAMDIQRGGPEFCKSEEWLNIWWPADELLLIQLCTQGRLDDFYREAEALLDKYLANRGEVDYLPVLQDALKFNQNLIKLPFKKENFSLTLKHNIGEIYFAALRGERQPVLRGDYCYSIDCTTSKWSSWQDWCKEVVWYQHKKGAYLYNWSSST